ncbi:hypothetical protein I3843_09G170100 [Carya illinoinensis]|nr:hypothetical protein I3843_09G170100 [Carya illinoinensis]
MKANFRVEAAWTLSKKCPEIIKKAWSKVAVGEDASSLLRHKLANCALALKQWNSSRKREASATMKQKMNRIATIQEEEGGDQVHKLKVLQREVEHQLEEEELKWRQRAKQHWLKNGDRNTQFYHMHANQRRKTNTISQILGQQVILHL